MSLDPPDWATDATFSSGPIIGQPNKATPSGGMIAEGFDPTDPLAAEHINYLWNNHGQWINSIKAMAVGDGSDGDVVLDGTNTYASFVSKASSTYTAIRDIYADDLSITTASTLKMAGFRLYVRGVLTVSASCFLQHDGTVGGAGTSAGGGTGGTGGAGATGGSTFAAFAGGDGTVTPVAGQAGTNATNSLGGAGGNSGAGGGAGTGTGGTVTAPVAARGGARHFNVVTSGYLLGNNAGTATLVGLTGGAGGGGGSAAATAAGGAGGGGGGTLVIACSRLINGGTIRAAGGGGGAGWSLVTAPGDGGGGGGGGLILLLRGSKSGAGTITAPGGAGGAAGGTGAAGSAGSSGTVIELGL